MTRRLEGSRLGAPPPDTSGARIQHTGSSGVSSISRRRLTEVAKPAERPSQSDGVQTAEQSILLRSQAARERESIDEMLMDFITPNIPEPAILRRSVSILQNCISDLIPRLSGGEQLRDLATSLMSDEIDRRHEFLGRMREGLET